MGLWFTAMGVGGWIGVVAIWATLLALVAWAVCRLFPSARDRDLRAITGFDTSTGINSKRRPRRGR
jgi:hypothetical protein